MQYKADFFLKIFRGKFLGAEMETFFSFPRAFYQNSKKWLYVTDGERVNKYVCRKKASHLNN